MNYKRCCGVVVKTRIKVKLTLGGYENYFTFYDIEPKDLEAIIRGYVALCNANDSFPSTSLEEYLRSYDIRFTQLEDLDLELEF